MKKNDVTITCPSGHVVIEVSSFGTMAMGDYDTDGDITVSVNIWCPECGKEIRFEISDLSEDEIAYIEDNNGLFLHDDNI